MHTLNKRSKSFRGVHGQRGKELPREKREGRGGKGRKRLQTNPWILKTAHFVFHA